ncbi:MAG: endonuclease [Candidatus Krumholzibacteria bacterium]|nr:endonuclease [Candidatus Krumholzibacteria bacterium]
MRHFQLLHRSLLPLLLLILSATGPLAEPPPGYYATVDTSNPDALRTTLNAVIRGHVKIPYTSSATDTWDVLELADQDPLDANRILDVYRNLSHPKYSGGNDYYNREHTWPNSYGFPNNTSSNLPYTDCHHLFLCDIAYNNYRGNRIFADCESGCTGYPTAVHDGISGVNYTRDATPVGIWETWHDRRGDVARAILYLDVRYEGLGSEPDLIATDDVALIVASATGSNEPIAYMGLLTTLRLWHAEDPPDAKERHRNDVVYIYQQNRNPFIDYPEWAEMLFGDPTAAPDLPPAWAARVQIAGVAPNPFNPVTAITYRVSAPGPISLDIFALDGRRVRTLAAGVHAAGEYRLIWDGRGDDAGAVASGAYVLRLAGGGDIDRAKLLLLK